MTIDKKALVINREACPVCQSKDRTVLFSSKHNSPGFLDFIKLEKYYGNSFYDGYNNGPLKDLLYNVAECNNCHFVYLTEVLSDTGMGLLYNEWLDKELLKVHYSKLPYSTYEETILSIIKKHFSKKEKINLMDFGAGYGNFCSIATKKGFNTYAFDLSADKNDHMDSMGVTIINNLEKFNNYFSFIWVNQVFEHVSDPLGIVKQLQQSLTDDGLIFIAVPDCSNVKKILGEQGLSQDLFRLVSPHQHINAFTNSTLKLLGTNAGLTPMGMADFFQLYNTKLNFAELKLLAKKTIKNSGFSTGIFFRKTS
ncbi:MAG: class I SAM-dependent methyltransferase [Chitinophagaceae bacterium]|nr:class I SAM-dependent methyltransferase [Chitinophagaceae bacterium]